MLKEILIKDKSINIKQFNDFVSLSSSYEIDNICVPSYLLTYINANNISIAAQIDFPFGLSSLKTRSYEVLYSISSNASIIDLVINPFLLENRFLSKIKDEIKYIQDICEDRRKQLRCVLEYRLFSTEHILDLCDDLYKLRIDTVITSTGTMPNDFTDDFLVAGIIKENTPMNVIVSNVTRNKEDYIRLKELGIGVRSSCINTIQEIFGINKIKS